MVASFTGQPPSDRNRTERTVAQADGTDARTTVRNPWVMRGSWTYEWWFGGWWWWLPSSGCASVRNEAPRPSPSRVRSGFGGKDAIGLGWVSIRFDSGAYLLQSAKAG